MQQEEAAYHEEIASADAAYNFHREQGFAAPPVSRLAQPMFGADSVPHGSREGAIFGAGPDGYAAPGYGAATGPHRGGGGPGPALSGSSIPGHAGAARGLTGRFVENDAGSQMGGGPRAGAGTTFAGGARSFAGGPPHPPRLPHPAAPPDGSAGSRRDARGLRPAASSAPNLGRGENGRKRKCTLM